MEDGNLRFLRFHFIDGQIRRICTEIIHFSFFIIHFSFAIKQKDGNAPVLR